MGAYILLVQMRYYLNEEQHPEDSWTMQYSLRATDPVRVVSAAMDNIGTQMHYIW